MQECTPYLIFDGNCREAMQFYQQCLGGDLVLMPFSEAPGTPPDAPDRIIHAALTTGGTMLMASDSMPGQPVKVGDNVWLSLRCDSDDEVNTLFRKLAEGGTEVMPPGDQFWGDYFAMVTDRYGNGWMLGHQKKTS